MPHPKKPKPPRPFRDFSDAADIFSTLLFQIEQTMDTCPTRLLNQLNNFLAELRESARKQGTSKR